MKIISVIRKCMGGGGKRLKNRLRRFMCSCVKDELPHLADNEAFCASVYANIKGDIAKQIKSAVLNDYLVFGDETRLQISDRAVVNNALFNLSSGNIKIEECVFFGHNVSLITGTHNIHSTGEKRMSDVPKSGRDITIRRGAWIASNAVILGPCIVGENAVVGACSFVNKDVPANTVWAGVPARMIKDIR